ncbi:hypothetical protein ROLI_044640 [Roseobacter fucihabitans]|uniref:General stress protein FMN-binding split barrel domain-containing protein n=1 Tax=Roseobacter fucihabitans TaxID=1537242 RepID=A0ABZ2BZG8_9RHOB|nr:pyridoxamine 5'-phosphate oxidase family protein [Roseobacter litoralis]MBC6963943.1 hypothetical protein [Roseobacter litoralis]MBC6963972.1 hypothetical protein [Roseobacter litoralis]
MKTEDAGTPRWPHSIDADNRTIHFVTDSDSAKIYVLNADNDLALSFPDTDKMLFASVSGKSIVSWGRQLIHKLWRPYCDVFFGGGPGNADVAVIQVLPTQAEYWDNDKGKVAMAVAMTKAYFSDGGPDLGENAEDQLRLVGIYCSVRAATTLVGQQRNGRITFRCRS